MNRLQQALQAIDKYQRSHPVIGFPYAVVKKYGEDNGGFQSAILTYYAVLSLFPLLLVFTTLSQLLLHGDPALRARVASSVNHYFPIIGGQLEGAVHSPRKVGLALVISLLITLYGARGVASALQFSVSSLWQVPAKKRPPFLKNATRGFGIIFAGGFGFVIATLLAGYTAILGHDLAIRLLSILVSALVLWGTFIVLFKLAIAGNKRVKSVAIGALVAACGIQLLQTVGSTVLAHELKNLHTTNGTFALVLALMFWVYLQAQFILYSVEIDVVRVRHLFPRSIQPPLTDADNHTN